MECKYFEIGNLYCLLEYAMLYWNQIPISPDIWSRRVYRQKFVKNRLSDTRYHERLIKIAMSGPAKIFFLSCDDVMRETMQFESIYSLTFLIISITAFPLSSSFVFIFFLYRWHRLLQFHFIKYIWLTHTMPIWSVVFYSSRLISRKILFIHR